MVTKYLDGKYEDASVEDDGDEPGDLPFGASKENVLGWIEEIAETIRASQGVMDLKKVKEVDKRLKGCTNPERVPGSALSVLVSSSMVRRIKRLIVSDTSSARRKRNV